MTAVSQEPGDDGYYPSQIVSDSWGYEQTNVDFYRIVKRSGEWLTIRKMTAVETSNGPTSMTGRVVPGDDDPTETAFRRRLRYRDGKPIGFPIKSYGWASLWDGQPEYVTSYG